MTKQINFFKYYKGIKMKKKILGVLLTLSISATVQNSFASDAEGNYAIWGEGGLSCFQFNKARIAEKDDHFKAYLRGYLTSYNTLSADTYSITGDMKLPEAIEWIDNYCDEKSIDSFDRAIQMLITDIEADRYKTPNTQGITKGWGKQ